MTALNLDDPGLMRAIQTRRRRKCIAQDAHTPTPNTVCPRCGLTEGTR